MKQPCSTRIAVSEAALACVRLVYGSKGVGSLEISLKGLAFKAWITFDKNIKRVIKISGEVFYDATGEPQVRRAELLDGQVTMLIFFHYVNGKLEASYAPIN